MKTKGLRISDIRDDKCISLSEFLANISNPEQLNWSILWIDVTPKMDEGPFFSDLMNDDRWRVLGSFFKEARFKRY